MEAMRDILTRNMYQVRQRVCISDLTCPCGLSWEPTPQESGLGHIVLSKADFVLNHFSLLSLENRKFIVMFLVQIGTCRIKRNTNLVAVPRGQAGPCPAKKKDGF